MLTQIRWEVIFDDFTVPCTYSGNPELSRWVRRQGETRPKILKEIASKFDSIGLDIIAKVWV